MLWQMGYSRNVTLDTGALFASTCTRSGGLSIAAIAPVGRVFQGRREFGQTVILTRISAAHRRVRGECLAICATCPILEARLPSAEPSSSKQVICADAQFGH
jgi:hypothetical protein